MLTADQKQRIIDALRRRGAEQPCSRCGRTAFALVDGYFNHPIQFGLDGFSIGGPSLPTVVVVCNNCGFLSQHALGALGLLPEKSGEPR